MNIQRNCDGVLPKYWLEIRDIMDELLAGVTDGEVLEEMTSEEFIKSLPTTKRPGYREADKKLRERGLTRKDALIKIFNKVEPTLGDKYKGRIICARGEVFNLAGGRKLRRLEHCLYENLTCNGLRAIAKGRTTAQWNQDIRAMHERMPHCTSTDIKSFEAHNTADALNAKMESVVKLVPSMDEIYQHCCAIDDRFIDEAIANGEYRFQQPRHEGFRQVENKMVANRFKAKVRRGLMSGDYDTAFSGVYVAIGALLFVAKRMGWSYRIEGSNIVSDDFMLYDNGDDMLIFMKRKMTDNEAKLFRYWYACTGLYVKLEGTTDKLTEIQFCRHSIYDKYMLREPHRMVANTVMTGRTLSKINTSVYVAVKMKMEAIINRGNTWSLYYNTVSDALIESIGGYKANRKRVRRMYELITENTHTHQKFMAELQSLSVDTVLFEALPDMALFQLKFRDTYESVVDVQEQGYLRLLSAHKKM